MGLESLVDPELRVEKLFRAYDLLGGRGTVVATLRVAQSPLTQALDGGFRRRLLRADVQGRELETVWRVEVEGRHEADLVHLFPHNVLPPEGTPKGRGFELRDPAGRVVAWSDQEGRFLAPVLLVRDGPGALRVRCVLRNLRTGLTLTDAEETPLFDLVRRVGEGITLQGVWVRPGVDPKLRRHLGAAVLLATLWTA